MHHALRDCTGGRQDAAAGCALHPLRGRAAANFCKALVGLHNPYAAHNKRGQHRERRQGAAAGYALYALRGRAADGTGKRR